MIYKFLLMFESIKQNIRCKDSIKSSITHKRIKISFKIYRGKIKYFSISFNIYHNCPPTVRAVGGQSQKIAQQFLGEELAMRCEAQRTRQKPIILKSLSNVTNFDFFTRCPMLPFKYFFSRVVINNL